MTLTVFILTPHTPVIQWQNENSQVLKPRKVAGELYMLDYAISLEDCFNTVRA